jgi:outer membrane protein TolC
MTHFHPLRRRQARLAPMLPLLLSACVAYHAKPLDSVAPPPDSVTKLTVDASKMPTPALRQHRFDPSDGLDATEVAMLAVANNPDLRLMRDDLGIQKAQAFSAGLLPDPQLSWSQDFPMGSPAGTSTAFAVGITQDITALLLRSSVVKAAKLDTKAVELNLLWAEWQMVAQSRALFDRVRADQALLQDLQDALPNYDQLYHAIEAASARGNLSADVADGPLLAAADLKRQISETQQRLDQEQHDLRALLGLSEQAPLNLVDDPAQPEDAATIPADIDQRLAALPQRRPDLLALQTGYQAEEQRVRLAVLQQFPAITVGFNRARDNSNVNSRGYSIGVTLPIFNRGRGAIAVETATRQRLFDEYQARLAAARSDVDRLRIELPIVERQLQDSRRDAARLRQDQKAATQAFAAGRLDWNTFLTLSSAALTKQVESVQLALTLEEQKNLLRTLLGSELPAGT